MFGAHMAPGGDVLIREEMVASVPIESLAALQVDDILEDVERSNLEGGNDATALDTLAEVWTASPGMQQGLQRAGKLIERLKGFLPKGIGVLVDRIMRDAAHKAMPVYFTEPDEEDNDSSDDGDDNGRMAEWLFGNQERGDQLDENGDLVKDDINISRITPPSSSPLRRAASRPSISEQESRAIRRTRSKISNLSRSGSKVLSENTNLVKVEKFETEPASLQHDRQTTSGRGPRNSVPVKSQSQSQNEMNNTELAELVQILHERERMVLEAAPLSPPPSLERKSSHTDKSLQSKKRKLEHDSQTSQVSFSKRMNKIGSEVHLSQGAASSHVCSIKSTQSLHSRSSRILPSTSRKMKDDVEVRTRTVDIDWARSRALEQLIISDMRAGRRPTLPKLKCTSDCSNPSTPTLTVTESGIEIQTARVHATRGVLKR
jgi:hypothetical protein